MAFRKEIGPPQWVSGIVIVCTSMSISMFPLKLFNFWWKRQYRGDTVGLILTWVYIYWLFHRLVDSGRARVESRATWTVEHPRQSQPICQIVQCIRRARTNHLTCFLGIFLSFSRSAPRGTLAPFPVPVPAVLGPVLAAAAANRTDPDHGDSAAAAGDPVSPDVDGDDGDRGLERQRRKRRRRLPRGRRGRRAGRRRE